ncbi:hypothetical protein ACGFXC_36900 [Streptomyces sp. NPDC048507]|uniref:hypothetical protein n=1 Tax=Streptomyces sp. NPDC048507 TaxID=3365560 RepID=UPI0037138776
MDLDAARAYARRNPGDAVQARLLASLDPSWRPPAPLNLAPVRAEQAAARERAEADRRARSRAEAEAARTRPLNVGAVRKDRAPVMVAQNAPVAPPGATRAVGPDGRWRWAYVDPQLVGGDRWASLALGLTTAGPLMSLDVRRGDCGTHRGLTEIRRGHDGQLWAVVTISPDVARAPNSTVAHELAHVADEVMRLRTVGGVEAWLAEFRHRSGDAEHFAEGAEDWLEPGMRAADVLARAAAHQDYRARARGR